MRSSKLANYIKLVFLTFLIYLILYFIAFIFLGDKEVNFGKVFIEGLILALIIPLLSKKFSPFLQIKGKGSAQKAVQKMMVIVGAILAIIIIIFFFILLSN